MVVALLALTMLLFVGQPASSLKTAGIPVLLPRTFPTGVPDKIYAYIEELRNGAYTVQLQWTADCSGAEPCYIGTIEGGVADPVSGARTVQLRNGIAAKFTDFTCGGWCSKPFLTFRYKGTTYKFTLKGYTLAQLVASANSLFPPR